MCDGFLIEVCAQMELRAIVFFHITNRVAGTGSTGLYMPDKGERKSEPREKRIELISNMLMILMREYMRYDVVLESDQLMSEM